MNERVLQLFHDSLERCMRHARFIEVFYERLLGASGETMASFRKTERATQCLRLKASLYACVQAASGDPQALAQCRRMAARYAGSAGTCYEMWLEALVATAQTLDRHFTEETEEAWRVMLRPGIEVFKKMAV